MVDEGPTTAATLNAKFTGDDSDVMVKMAAVKAAATELGATDVDIKIDAKNADKATAAMMRARAAESALVTADDQLFASQRKVNNENDNGIKRWQAIALAVVALIPLLGPLLGYSAAIAGAMTTMGLAGIAAIFGIREEMAKGTTTGDAYASGIRTLKGNLDELGHTAAVAMLTSYEGAISLIQAHMPQLNRDTSLFATQLGTAGLFITNGVLTGLQALLPLLLTGGVYIERIGMGFQTWTQNGGIEKFGSYALNVLPQVSATLGQLVKLIGDIVIAAAPWGSVMLHAIQAVSFVLDQFPLPVLGAIAAGAIAGYGAFKLWGGISGGVMAVRDAMAAVNDVIKANIPLTAAEIAQSSQLTSFMALEAGVAEAVAAGEKEVAVSTTAMGTAMDFASGPVGIVFAALGALAAIISVAVSSTGSATDATNDYTAALQQDSGAIGDNVRAQLASNLQKDGAIDAANKLGIATKTLTEATLGNGSAQDTLRKKISDLNSKLQEMDQANANSEQHSGAQTAAAAKLAAELQTLTDAYESQKVSIKDQIKAYNDIQTAIGGTTISTQGQYNAQLALANQYGLSLPAYANASAASKKQADQANETTNELRLENNAATLLTNALTKLNGGSLDVATAQTGLAAANNSLVDSLKQNKTAVDDNSKASVANQQAIQASVQAAQQYAEAVGTSTGSSEQARQALIDSKTAMEQALGSQGLLTDSVQAYIDKIFQIPASLPPTKLDVDNAVAKQKLQEELDLLNRINAASQARYQGLAAKYAAMGQIGPGYATGGTIQALADGGQSGTVYGPGSSTSDSIFTRLSRGEEVIKASSAQQVRPLLKAINRDPQGTVGSLVNAGAAAGAASTARPSGPALHIDRYYAAADQSEAELAQQLGWYSNWAGGGNN